ncbi:MAG: NUDIX hydrolase [Emcibacter sp.]|nr:NUDIX hydrolase [Emcibacter sp.]
MTHYTIEREYPTRPYIGVGVVVIKEDSVLLIKRSKPPKPDSWSIPGGMQEIGETVIEAACREVMEETAITIQNLSFLDIIDYIDQDENNAIRHHYTLVDYGAYYHSGTLNAGDDARDAKWVPIDKLCDYNLWIETEKIIHKALETLTRQVKNDR